MCTGVTNMHSKMTAEEYAEARRQIENTEHVS